MAKIQVSTEQLSTLIVGLKQRYERMETLYKAVSVILERISESWSAMFAHNFKNKIESYRKTLIAAMQKLLALIALLERALHDFEQTDKELEKETEQIEDPSKKETPPVEPEEVPLSEYEKYRQSTDSISEKVPVGQSQQTEASGYGLCTYSATTTLLQRKQAADGVDPTFSFSDVHRASGGNGQVNADGRWPNSEFLWGNTYTSGNSSYTMKYEWGAKSQDEVRTMLDSHPEGIIVYSPSSGGNYHAIVITDYEVREDGSMQFYADDPVNDRRASAGRIPIEDTYLSEVNGDIFGSASVIAYF